MLARCVPPSGNDMTLSSVARFAVLSLLASAAACGAKSSFVGGTYHDDEATYRVGHLSHSWERVALSEGDLAFKHEQGGTILANATCAKANDAPLDVLANHLLFDLEQVEEVSRNEMTLDGRRALRVHVLAELDGVPVELDVVVLKKDGCTYDFVLIGGRDAFVERRADFENFFRGFGVG
jgi:hypothetical protein